MVIRGRVRNGVVVLEDTVSVPEGTEVTVMVGTPQTTSGGASPDAERQRVLEIMDRIAALPLEGDPKPFSGADHDKVLYGKP
jgi:hypothetical protein